MEDRTTSYDPDEIPPTQGRSAARTPCVVVITGRHAGKVFRLDGEQMMIGRSSSAFVRLDDDGVSRSHAQITRLDPDSFELSDLSSTNGTFRNGMRIRRAVLQDGDRLQVGTKIILKFTLQDPLEEEFLRKQYEQATRCSLTGCFNRNYFLEHLPSEFAFARRHDKKLALVIFDLDHFKQINDTWGHPAGDSALTQIVRIMRTCLRAEDILARYGGEEFAVIMRETDAAAATYMAERVRKTVESTELSYEGQRFRVTVSAGVAACQDGGPESWSALLRQADAGLYEAKEKGRNRTVLRDPA